MEAGVLQTHGITSSLHHLSSTQNRPIQFRVQSSCCVQWVSYTPLVCHVLCIPIRNPPPTHPIIHTISFCTILGKKLKVTLKLGNSISVKQYGWHCSKTWLDFRVLVKPGTERNRKNGMPGKFMHHCMTANVPLCSTHTVPCKLQKS